MAGVRDGCRCANEDQKRLKLLEKVVKAQARMLVAYRRNQNPPEWTFETLARAKRAGIEC